MKIYYSGGLCIEKKDAYLVDLIKARLLSYHYVSKGNTAYYWGQRDARPGYMTMLDSGAFTVWNKGKPVDFEKYLKYACETQDKWDVIIVLDQIPGSPGHKNVSLAERDHCANISWERYQIMLKAGIPAEKLMPVFHQGEQPKWMKKMIDNCPLIGISPANDRTPEEKKVWLNDTMDIACNPDGTPRSRFHGLAVTSPSLMRDYPWHSVDSASWAIGPGNGRMTIPYYKGPHNYDFFHYTSIRTGKYKNFPDHIEAVPQKEREQMLLTLFEAGFIESPDMELPDDRNLRMRVTTWFFDNLEKEVNKQPPKWRMCRKQTNLGLHL